MKLAVLIAFIHFIISIGLSFYRIWLQTELARGGMSSSATTENLDTVLQVLLFPTTAIFGDWLSNQRGGYIWLAIGGTSLLWGLFFTLVLIISKSSQAKIN